MNIGNLDLVPLRQASLCMDCETITAAHTNCLACGSRALLNIARALDYQDPPRQRVSERVEIICMPVRRSNERGISSGVESSLRRIVAHRNTHSARFGTRRSENRA